MSTIEQDIHPLWGQAKDSPSYDKRLWNAFQIRLLVAMKDLPESAAVDSMAGRITELREERAGLLAALEGLLKRSGDCRCGHRGGKPPCRACVARAAIASSVGPAR